jgi:glycosidase
MAKNTPSSYRNLVIYEIYVRNHGPDGNLANVTADLPRIREMGVDVVWFMPIHPIGEKNKKGSLGCPYSIQDYRGVNPEYGGKKEFEMMVQYAHALGLKVMIDVVFNHTAHDAALLAEHPEWYHQGPDGKPMTTVPAWSDIIDLNYGNEALWDYQIETLKLWAAAGVDGFRCDVASVVPLEFWRRARTAVSQINPDMIWLAETTHTAFLVDRRRRGLTAHADGEIHRVFDLSYDYDIWPLWEKAVADPAALSLYYAALWQQKGIYPTHAIKMRCVENHDQPRIMARAPGREQALAWTAFQAFNDGPFLIYAGQEAEATHTPSLFDVDKIRWQGYRLQPYLTRLCKLKKDVVMVDGRFTLLTSQPALSALWQGEAGGLFGAFNVAGVTAVMAAPLPDGTYTNLLDDRPVEVRDGEMAAPDTAVVLRYEGEIDSPPIEAPLFW